MTKFTKAKLHIDLVEAAYDAVMDTAMREVRYSPSEYLDNDYREDQSWKNSEYLKQHLNAKGQELLKQAQSLADQIEGLL